MYPGSGDEDFQRVLHAPHLLRGDVAYGYGVLVSGAHVPVALDAAGGSAERADDTLALQEQGEELLEHGLETLLASPFGFHHGRGEQPQVHAFSVPPAAANAAACLELGNRPSEVFQLHSVSL